MGYRGKLVERERARELRATSWTLADNPNWPGHTFVDARETGWQELVRTTAVRRALGIGADGVFLDMLDVAEWERRWSVMLERALPRRFASVYFDAIDVMRDEETRAAFRRMLEHAVRSGWCVTGVAEVERAWRPLATR